MSSACFSATSNSSCYTDTTLPASGETFYYLVRANAPHVGSWGADGDGTERTGVCTP